MSFKGLFVPLLFIVLQKSNTLPLGNTVLSVFGTRCMSSVENRFAHFIFTEKWLYLYMPMELLSTFWFWCFNCHMLGFVAAHHPPKKPIQKLVIPLFHCKLHHAAVNPERPTREQLLPTRFCCVSRPSRCFCHHPAVMWLMPRTKCVEAAGGKAAAASEGTIWRNSHPLEIASHVPPAFHGLSEGGGGSLVSVSPTLSSLRDKRRISNKTSLAVLLQWQAPFFLQEPFSASFSGVW